MSKEQERLLLLMGALHSALREPVDMRKKWRTDVYGIAKQYAAAYRPKATREEFMKLKEMKLEDILNTILQ